MKPKHLILTSLTLAALAVGCNPSAPPSGGAASKSTADQLAKAKADTQETAQEMADYAYAQKSEFLTRMQAQLTEINRDLDLIAAKVDKASDAAKAEATPKLQALREKTATLVKQLETVDQATESTWADVKAGFKQGFEELKGGFQQARQWVSEKIAP